MTKFEIVEACGKKIWCRRDDHNDSSSAAFFIESYGKRRTYQLMQVFVVAAISRLKCSKQNHSRLVFVVFVNSVKVSSKTI